MTRPGAHQNEPSDSDGDGGGETESLVDTGLIDEMLCLSPEERLLLNDRLIRTIVELQDAFQSN
jgi:nitrous oxidase accessory protein NosD